MKRLIFVCLLFCASLAFAQADGPGGPTGSGTPSKCGRPNCTVSGTLTVSGTQAYISGSLYAGPGKPNEATTGTTNGLLAKEVNVGGVIQYKTCATTDTAIPCWPVVAQRNTSTNVFTTTTGTAATTNNSYIDSTPGDTPICTFDNTSVVGNYVVASITAGGQCHDTGSTLAPASGFIVGRSQTAGTGNQSVSIEAQLTTTEHVISFSLVKSGAIGVFPVVDFACTIYRVDVTADQSGTIALDIWKANAAIPAAGNKISGTTWTPLSGAQSAFNTTLAGWSSTAVASGDVFGGTVGTFTTVTNVLVQIRCH